MSDATTEIVQPADDAPLAERLEFLTQYMPDNADEWDTHSRWIREAIQQLSAEAYLLAACEAVAEYHENPEAADWKDAWGRLTQLAGDAIARATGATP